MCCIKAHATTAFDKMTWFVYGAGGHGAVVLDCLLSSGVNVDKVFDDRKELHSQTLLGVVVGELSTTGEANFGAGKRMHVAIGSNEARKAVATRLCAHGFEFPVVCHPHALVSKFCCHIGQGTLVGARVVCEVRVTVGSFSILNTGCILTHDCSIGDYCHVAPGAVLLGGVKVGDNCLLGANCTILPGVTIGRNVTVGAGCIVTRDVPDNVVVRGEPGRIVVKEK